MQFTQGLQITTLPRSAAVKRSNSLNTKYVDCAPLCVQRVWLSFCNTSTKSNVPQRHHIHNSLKLFQSLNGRSSCENVVRMSTECNAKLFVCDSEFQQISKNAKEFKHFTSRGAAQEKFSKDFERSFCTILQNNLAQLVMNWTKDA